MEGEGAAVSISFSLHSWLLCSSQLCTQPPFSHEAVRLQWLWPASTHQPQMVLTDPEGTPSPRSWHHQDGGTNSRRWYQIKKVPPIKDGSHYSQMAPPMQRVPTPLGRCSLLQSSAQHSRRVPPSQSVLPCATRPAGLHLSGAPPWSSRPACPPGAAAAVACPPCGRATRS